MTDSYSLFVLWQTVLLRLCLVSIISFCKTKKIAMNINEIFVFIGTGIILLSTSSSQSADAWIRRRNKDGSCLASNDCYRFEKCENKKCIDGCKDIVCGTNAWCQMIDHSPICSCWENHSGDPYTECMRLNCTITNDCYEFEKCTSNKCINACESFSCGDNARCKAKYHDAFCTCEFGLIGDPLVKCTKRNCTVGNDCYHFEKCENKTCIDACESSSCGHNATCSAKDHTTVCTCVDKYAGNPYTGCVRENCTTSDDCYDFEKCTSNRCIPACESILCGENAWCNEKDHIATCTCAWGFTGDPRIKCVERSCTTSEDCHQSEQCDSNKCTQICEGILCGTNAWCDTSEHSPICICTDNYGGDPYTECFRLNCTINNDCYETEKCEDSQCIPLCEAVSCGENAWCDVKDHTAVCTCMPGLFGDPFTKCAVKGCTKSSDCSDTEKCESKKCIDACEEIFCGANMWCNAKDHIPVCTCSDKYSGDIYIGCVRSNCTANDDCYLFEECERNECIPACDSVTCEENAWCNVKDHVAICACMPGLTCDLLTGCDDELRKDNDNSDIEV